MTISIPDDVAATLDERAAAGGQSAAAYAARLLADTLTRPTPDELLAPVRKQVAESGMTDAQFDAFIDEVRDDAFADRLDSIFSRARLVTDVPTAFGLPRDPKDEPYINLAVAVRPCYLVTWNDRQRLLYSSLGGGPNVKEGGC